MGIFDDLFSSTAVQNEQLAQHIFDNLPDNLIMVIIDKDGGFWSNKSENQLDLSDHQEYVNMLCCRVDDGVDTVLGQIEHVSLAVSQLCIDAHHCGYILLAIPETSPEITLANLSVIELAMAQTNMIASLIRNNNSLHHESLKRTHSITG